MARLREISAEDSAYLVPLRLFIGLGWLRACAEKVFDPGWRDGSSLTAFLSDHVAAGDVAFPWYETLIDQVFLPHAAALGPLILLGQLLAGMAIAAGGLTNAALLSGLFMNVNFLLAGAPNPSTFYIVIQIALLLTNAGAILGLDARLARTIRNPLIVAQPRAARRRRHWRVPMRPIGSLSLVTAVYSLAHVTDWSPAGSVEDPAMIVAILALLGLIWAAIAWLRLEGGRRPPRLGHTGARSRSAGDRWVTPGFPRFQPLGAVVAGRRVAASRAGWSGARLRPRRLVLTLSLIWLDDADHGGDCAGGQGIEMSARGGASRAVDRRAAAVP